VPASASRAATAFHDPCARSRFGSEASPHERRNALRTSSLRPDCHRIVAVFYRFLMLKYLILLKNCGIRRLFRHHLSSYVSKGPLRRERGCRCDCAQGRWPPPGTLSKGCLSVFAPSWGTPSRGSPPDPPPEARTAKPQDRRTAISPCWRELSGAAASFRRAKGNTCCRGKPGDASSSEPTRKTGQFIGSESHRL
jgi:hypothetical protein